MSEEKNLTTSASDVDAKIQAQLALTEVGQLNQRFALLQRMASAYCQSTIVPESYRGNIGNCYIACEMANRMNCNPLMVMQNLYMVHGNPGWSSKFLVAAINMTNRYSPLEYEFTGEQGSDSWGCRAVALRMSDKKELRGSLVTIKMAKDEGWYDKKGSKWKTMPELMLQYRAAAFFQRVYCPEISMGMLTADEIEDTIDVTYQDVTDSIKTSANTKSIDFKEVVDEEPQPASQPVQQEQAATNNSDGQLEIPASDY